MPTDAIRIVRPLLPRALAAVATLAITNAAVAQAPAVPVSPWRTNTDAAALRFDVTFDEELAESYSGRVYVLCSTSSRGEPRFGPQWFGTDPFLSIDVEDWKPGDTITLAPDNALSYPGPMTDIPERDYAVQAVIRLNHDSPHLGTAPGNAYSAVFDDSFDGATGGTIKLHIEKIVNERPFPESDRLKIIEHRSDLLSDFYDRDDSVRAAVFLPDGYDNNPDSRYPAMYVIPGFGADHRFIRRMVPFWARAGYNDRVVRIVLDPLCFGGHHVFADSDNNGPRGRALVEEFIPFLESKFRLVAEPTARFLNGHSSGGWSSLWLQITYPDFFGGTWSTAPDPVDFSSFQLIDIYRDDANAYTDENGERIAVAHQNGEAFAWYDDFTAMETVYGEGQQLRSFEWVFSPPSKDGKPMQLYDRETGAIDPTVAEHWKRYDIRLILEDNWTNLGPRVKGKLNVHCGDQDTFYLHPAVAKLKASLDRLGSDAVVEIHPGKDHGTLMSVDLMQRIHREMIEQFDAAHPEHTITDQP